MPSSQVLSVATMQAAEQALMDAGISVHELMQRAGCGAAEWVWRISGGRPVTILCGPGNNGGDGYVIACEIAKRGGEVCVIAPIPPKTEAAQRAADLFGGEISPEATDASGDVFVDCLFGSGLTRPLSPEHVAMIAQLLDSHVHSVAIDVPSGVDADTGSWQAGLAAYDCTISLGAWKRAHWTGPAANQMGSKKLVDIGVGDQASGEAVWPQPVLAVPTPDSHKYRRGLLAVIGGEMPGAALLAAKAAMGGGAGYVKLFASRKLESSPADLVVDLTDLADALGDRRIKAVLVGPGLGRGPDAREMLAQALAGPGGKVLDADALMLLEPGMLEGVDATRIVITPHEGELQALSSAFAIKSDSKRDCAEALHRATGMIVLAKGPDTILVHAEGVGYFPAGSSWLSVAGSGDVLAGIIASRLATGEEPAQAAAQGVWVHHEAARQAGVAFSASTLADAVSSAYAAYL
ncbi:NAD(P)H-hydrate epimerase [Parerythrobacter jejuensis]|uniref:Bifunctional NAD(P)H-hydrate repair enzyme n=1 Tax=Parerythrobacter jejuensis TaxID=795812 RepID=A0A845AT21_9SPHN|nr:NAD(P)H-hydrate epimerase [Parerythrobacter jejuensis]MXP32507.1 NAD(P)H-hydrate epimerase [Parerythrobacter jejuensis]